MANNEARRIAIMPEFDFESALRICARVHREAGQDEVAKLFEDGADREQKRKVKAYYDAGNPTNWSDYVKRTGAIVT